MVNLDISDSYDMGDKYKWFYRLWKIDRLDLNFCAILKVVVCIARLGYLGPDDC